VTLGYVTLGLVSFGGEGLGGGAFRSRGLWICVPKKFSGCFGLKILLKSKILVVKNTMIFLGGGGRRARLLPKLQVFTEELVQERLQHQKKHGVPLFSQTKNFFRQGNEISISRLFFDTSIRCESRNFPSAKTAGFNFY